MSKLLVAWRTHLERRNAAERARALRVSNNWCSNYQLTNLPTYQLTNSPTHQSGFTLIELLVVIALITILASMGMAQYKQGIVHAREAVLKTDLFDLRDAIDQYYADKNQYPGSLDSLVTDGYLRKIPVDPFTNAADSWQTVLSEPDPNNPTAQPGIFNVKSGFDGTALDGSHYSDSSIW